MDMTPLIDGRIVAQTFALRREVTAPQPKSPGKVITPGSSYGSVLRGGDGQWRIWYLAQPYYCQYFATSADGLHWVKPSLDLVSPEVRAKAEGPNPFLAPNQKDAAGRWLVHDKGPEGFCVLDSELTPHPAARSRYTVMYLARAHLDGKWIKGLHVAHSDDGLHWLADEHNPVIPGWRDTANMFFYDERLKRYVWYGRPEAHVASGMEANRLISRMESEDLIHWTPERTVLDTDDRDADPMDLVDEIALKAGVDVADAQARARAAAQAVEATSVGKAKPLIRGRNRQFYGITAFPCGGLYIGLAWLYDILSGEIWIELLHSYDGVDWRREALRKPFLSCPPGDMRTSASSPPVAVGDELWLYTCTRGYNHQHRPSGLEAGIEVHALKRDRWVAYTAETRLGELLTQPLPRGRRIALNARTQPGGSIRVAVRDAAGGIIEGFGLLECAPMTGDSLEMTPTWAGKTAADLPAEHQTIRLRVVMDKASVFALEA